MKFTEFTEEMQQEAVRLVIDKIARQNQLSVSDAVALYVTECREVAEVKDLMGDSDAAIERRLRADITERIFS